MTTVYQHLIKPYEDKFNIITATMNADNKPFCDNKINCIDKEFLINLNIILMNKNPHIFILNVVNVKNMLPNLLEKKSNSHKLLFTDNKKILIYNKISHDNTIDILENTEKYIIFIVNTDYGRVRVLAGDFTNINFVELVEKNKDLHFILLGTFDTKINMTTIIKNNIKFINEKDGANITRILIEQSKDDKDLNDILNEKLKFLEMIEMKEKQLDKKLMFKETVDTMYKNWKNSSEEFMDDRLKEIYDDIIQEIFDDPSAENFLTLTIFDEMYYYKSLESMLDFKEGVRNCGPVFYPTGNLNSKRFRNNIKCEQTVSFNKIEKKCFDSIVGWFERIMYASKAEDFKLFCSNYERLDFKSFDNTTRCMVLSEFIFVDNRSKLWDIPVVTKPEPSSFFKLSSKRFKDKNYLITIAAIVAISVVLPLIVEKVAWQDYIVKNRGEINITTHQAVEDILDKEQIYPENPNYLKLYNEKYRTAYDKYLNIVEKGELYNNFKMYQIGTKLIFPVCVFVKSAIFSIHEIFKKIELASQKSNTFVKIMAGGAVIMTKFIDYGIVSQLYLSSVYGVIFTMLLLYGGAAMTKFYSKKYDATGYYPVTAIADIVAKYGEYAHLMCENKFIGDLCNNIFVNNGYNFKLFSKMSFFTDSVKSYAKDYSEYVAIRRNINDEDAYNLLYEFMIRADY